MKKKLNTMAILSLLLLVTGCSPVTKLAEESNQPSDTVSEDIQNNNTGGIKHISKKLSDNFYIDADIEEPAAKEYGIYSVKNKVFDKAALDLFLLKDDNDRTFTENPNRPQTLIVDTGKGSSLLMGDGSVNYLKNNVRDSEIQSLIESYLLTGEASEDTKELDFQSKDDAIALGINKIKEVVDCQAEAVRAVAISHDRLEQLQDSLSKNDIYQAELKNGSSNKIEELSAADDLYYIQYAIKVDDLPLYNAILEPGISMNIDAFWDNKVNITIMADRDGIRYFNFNNVFDSFDKIKEKKAIITAEEALQKVEEKYNNMILTDKTTISKIWLEYIPVPVSWKDPSVIELRPYWCIQLDITDKDGQISNAERINAVTGGNLANGE